MAFNDRLKEARIANGLTQKQLAEKLGIAGTTVTGYEKGNSEPNVNTIGKIMEVLRVDANFLWQDEMKELSTKDFSISEIKIIKKYRKLDTHGKKIVDMVLDEEAARCESERKAAESAYLVLSAAHEIPGSSEEDSCFDDEIMQDENF